jgi:Domain of unknown function (DUF4397)
MSSRLLTCLFAGTALLSAACDDSTGISANQAANVRIVNASPAVGTLGVAVNGNTQANASNVGFLAAGDQCVRVNATNPQLTVQQTGGTVTLPTNTAFTFDQGGRNTVVVSGTSATNLRVTTVSDPVTPALQAGRARLRVFNATTRATAMDVVVTPWNATSGTVFANLNTSTNPVSTWFDVPAGGTVQVRLNNTGTQTTVDIINFVPTQGQELTLVAVDPASGSTGLRWIVSPACNAP